HVPAYLTGQKYPGEQPDGYSPGQESEALVYVGGFLAAWRGTPGAVAWLRDNVKTGKKKGAAPKGPLDAVKKWLPDPLPQRKDAWQADFRQVANPIGIDGEPVRPWLVVVISPESQLILAHQVSEERPSAELLWDTLAQAMQQPAMGEAHRPSTLQVRAD